MKHELLEKVEISLGIECEYKDKVLTCKKGPNTLSRKLEIPKVEIRIDNNSIVFHCAKANKNELKAVYSFISHIKNMFSGLNEKFIYRLEACNVHFPMNLKVESGRLSINNFLGEKKPRYAKILPNVDVEIKGQQIIVSSHDKEAAGQTATNFEKATKVRNRDRRVFQDGIFITEKPGDKK